MTASLASTITCSALPSTLAFGELTLDSDKTTSSGSTIDASGSNAPSKLTVSITDASSWVPGFQSTNNAWGVLCPASGGTVPNGLADSTGYSRHEFNPGTNDCRNPLGATGLTVGQGAGTIPTLVQKTDTHSIFSRIQVPSGTSPGTFSSTLTFTCSEITGPAAGLSFELADVEGLGGDSQTMCDGVTSNTFVAQAGMGPGPAFIDDNILSSIFVCDAQGDCVAASVTQMDLPGFPCGNSVPPIAGTPNELDIVCGEFTCPPGVDPGPGQVIIETGPLNDPAGEVVQSYLDVTIL